jgi:hypothetical protein
MQDIVVKFGLIKKKNMGSWFSICLEVWLSCVLKCFSAKKYIKIIFIYFLKFIFDISTSKQLKNNLKQNKFQNF